MKQLPVRDALTLIDTAASGHKPLLLDVREAWEFQLASIAVAQDKAETLHIPMNEVPQRLSEIERERTIICVCHHGMRSLHVAHFLAQQGYDDVLNLQGGIDAWSLQIDPSVPRY